MATRTIGSGQVGRSVPRLEGAAKVTGRAEYVHNIRLPKMLIGKIFRSTVAHGRIKSLDVSRGEGAARRLSRGHHRRHQDVIPNPFYGPAFHDQPILADGKVHYIGEPVAVVLATDPHVAEEAASLIEAEYEELPAVFDEVEAMTSKAVVHDELKPAGTFPDLKHLKGKKDTNVALDFHLRRGDPQKAFAEADHVFEHTFRSQQVLHVPLEPFVSVAELTETGLTIHTASQSPSFVRIEISRLLGWPENKVRVKVPYLGGGFGAKLYIKLEALVAALTLLDAPAGEDLAHHGRAVLHADQARGDVPHQERGQERQDHRPRLRGVVERRRLCRYRSAHHAEVGLHRARPLRHRQRVDRFLFALHQPDAGRRAARLRHPATGVGL